MPDTDLSFGELLNAAYDFNSPPPDLTALARRQDVIAFIQAFSRERPPSFPTTALAQDLMRTFGEADGKALLSYASALWDDDPITAEQVDALWFDPQEAFEPQAWQDVVLVQEIANWKSSLRPPRHRHATDFAAPNPPVDAVLAFAKWHSEFPAYRNFHWYSMAYDLRRRYGDRVGRILFEIGLVGYPAPGRPEAYDDQWRCSAVDYPHPVPRPRYCDESLVTRMRGWRDDVTFEYRRADIRLEKARAEAMKLEDHKWTN